MISNLIHFPHSDLSMHLVNITKSTQVITLCGLLCLAVSGCATDKSSTPVYAADSQPAPTSDVTKLQAWRDAEALAALDPDRLTVIGTGASMRPVYGDNTVLVLQKLPYDDLVEGMTVAYRNKAGHVVVHNLVQREESGWRVAGLNNNGEDRGVVTRYNLIGVVYASFAHDGVH